jgi:hypothetical protein
MLDDYPAGKVPLQANACAGADMTLLDTVSATTPIDLATLTSAAPFAPTSGASSPTAYNSANGYWQAAGKPVVTGCLKIELVNAAGVATDVTTQMLSGAKPLSPEWGGFPQPACTSGERSGQPVWSFGLP